MSIIVVSQNPSSPSLLPAKRETGDPFSLRVSRISEISSSTDSSREDLVSKMVEIVKKNAPTRNFIQMNRQLKTLAVPKKEISAEMLQSLIEQVKGVESLKEELPLIYRHLLLELSADPKDTNMYIYNLPGFSGLDEEFRIACALHDLEKRPSELITNIQKYGIKNQGALIAIAKLAAKKMLFFLCTDIQKFGIKDRQARLEIAQMALEQDIWVSPLIRYFDLHAPDYVGLFLRNRHLFPEDPSDFILSFFTTKMVADNPEINIIAGDMLFNIPKFLKNLAKKNENLALLVQDLLSEHDKISKGLSGETRDLDITWMILYCSVLDYAKKSPLLLEKMITLLDAIRKESNPQIKMQTIRWIATLLINCHARRVSYSTLMEYWPLVENVLRLRDPALRMSLSRYLCDVLENPSLLGKDIAKKPRTLMLASLLTLYAKKIDTHRDSLKIKLTPLLKKKPGKESQKGPLQLKAELSTFTDRMQKALAQDHFKDKKRMKALLRSLEVLSSTKKLTDEEKVTILRDLIFVDDSSSAQILRSVQQIAQLIDCGGDKVLKSIKNQEELENGLRTFLFHVLDLDIENFNAKFAKTFGSWRNPDAFLIYVGKLCTLPQQERELVMPFLKKYAESVLEDAFFTTRYSVGRDASEHMLKLHTVDPDLLEQWKLGAVFSFEDEPEYNVVDTDNPCDLLLMGTETDSCQRVHGDPDQNKCLLSCLLDPKIRMMAVKNKEGNIIARCVLRLLWNQEKNKFVLFQEKIYYANKEEEKFSKMLNIVCIERANELGVPLCKEGDKRKKFALESLKGNLPFEYVDANELDEQTGDGYVIKGWSYVDEELEAVSLIVEEGLEPEAE